MFTIDSNYAITLTRGDTATLEITFEGDAPTAEDTVIAAVKASKSAPDAVLEKALVKEDDQGETGTKWLLQIESADTEPLAFGAYWWDLRVLYADGQITTPFPPAPFKVAEVVTDLPDGDDP